MHGIDFASTMIKKLNKEVELRRTSLGNGNISTMEQYKNIVGEISGLSLAIDEIHALLENMEKLNG